MAQWDYLGTWNDFWTIMSIIERNEQFDYIPDLNYRTPTPLRWKSVLSIEYRNLIRDNLRASRVYIWSREFSWPDLIIRDCKGERGYNVEQVQPVLDLSSPPDFLELPDGSTVPTFAFNSPTEFPHGSLRKLNCGTLSCPDEYPDPTGRWHKRSPELKAAYQRVCSHMKKVMVRHKFKSYIWMGREAHQLVKEGKAVVIAHV